MITLQIMNTEENDSNGANNIPTRTVNSGIVFSGQMSRFTLDFHDGRIRVNRMPGERYAACCISEHDRFGGGSVMIWASIWHGGRTSAIIIKIRMATDI